MMVNDPTCGMEVNTTKAKKKGLVLRKDKETFYFCSKDCLGKFKVDSNSIPTKCAKCMKECDLEKTLWKIKHKGKFYCFCCKNCKHDFQEKEFGEIIY